ncbi:hypothetical protein [Bradyrhizobium ivorense]|uniref:hypothetical protein n=1 Tax=Bradyrhizobium ivorense TaxID=2511166 RepID=UPI0010BB4741|nr:hypothetical protein [Bradyrhizobium ivorense]VIO73865.1 hypothetical protein CI41S_39740 [Bradyrhizobium ivorense]
MSLTPKNWKAFQHYNQRRPPWIKLHRSLLDDLDFEDLPLASQALAPRLWLLASEYEGGVITLEPSKIARRLRMVEAEYVERLQPLLFAGYFVADALSVSASEPPSPRKQDASKALSPEPLPRREETEAERETETRAKTRPASAQIDLEEAIAAKRAVDPAARFDEFWQAYPRRDGPNPRKPAESRFAALVKTGLDPAMLIDAARKLASDEGARGNIGTRFIPQAVTWLNQQRWSDHAAVAFVAEAAGVDASELQLESAVAFYARTRRWSRHAGPEPGLTGCRASPELLAKYGLGIDGRKIETEAAL